MKILFQVFLLNFVLSVCIKDDNTDNTVSVINEGSIPIVHSEAIFNVLIEEGIVYAEGLSHQSINSTNATSVQLKLDVFVPDNDMENRPAIMLIHGGGLAQGTRKQDQIVNIANYFAARGWVAFSIDYRLRNDLGTVPQDWVHYAASLDPSLSLYYLSVYPAHRDAKAALRWVVSNASSYNINTNYITVGGGSSGAGIAVALGISNQEDYRDELSLTQDPTLATANTEQSYQVKTILDFWGSKSSVDYLEKIDGHHRFDSTDAPILIAHGTKDPIVPFSRSEELKAIYEATGVPYVFYPLESLVHWAWNTTVDGKRLEDLSFDFIVEQQKLTVE